MGSKDVGVAEGDRRERGSKPLWWHMKCCLFCACSGRLGIAGGVRPLYLGPVRRDVLVLMVLRTAPFQHVVPLQPVLQPARYIHLVPGEQQLLWLALLTWKHREREVIQSYPVSQWLSRE